MSNLGKNIKRILAIAFVAVTLAACGQTQADTVGLHYNDGPLEGESFNQVVEPGSGQKFIGPGDRIINISTSQRDYTFCEQVRSEPGEAGCDAPPIQVTALGGAELGISGGVTFEIATGDPDTLKAFYEELCRKFNCANEDGIKEKGWAELLRVNLRGPIEDALQEEIRGYSVDALYAGIPAEGEGVSEDEALSTLTQVSDNLAATLKETINDYVGGQFFCGPAYDRNHPKDCPDFEFIITEVTPSKQVAEAFDKNVASRQGVVDARNRAEAAVAEANGTKEAQAALDGLYNDAGYIDWLRVKAYLACSENPNCTMVIGADDNVNINTGK